MDEKYERWLLKAINEVLRTTRDCAKRLGNVEKRLEGLEAALGKAGAPGPAPVPESDDEPGLEPEPVEESDTPAPMPATAAAAAAAGAAGGEEYIKVADDAELATIARASQSTKVMSRKGEAAPAPAKPEEVDAPPEAAQKSADELCAAFRQDPDHCPQCDARLTRKVKECNKCGLLLPKSGSRLKKILVTLLVLVLLLAGTGAVLHFTGHLPGVLGKIPWVRDNIPTFLTPPSTESGPPMTETGPPEKS